MKERKRRKKEKEILVHREIPNEIVIKTSDSLPTNVENDTEANGRVRVRKKIK